MKLNVYQKEAIVRAIVQDIPKPTHSEQVKLMQDALVKAMSPAARRLYKTAPAALKTVRISAGEALIDYGVDLIRGDADYTQALAPFFKQAHERNAAVSELKKAVMGCSSLAQLHKMLPEFQSYFPSKDEPTKNLPAVANVVSSLVKLGWPKGQGGAA